MSITITCIGAKWCSTCKTIRPAVEELAKRNSVAFFYVDYDADLDEEEQKEITKVPTIRIFRDDVLVAEYNVSQVASVTSWLLENISLAPTEDF